VLADEVGAAAEPKYGDEEEGAASLAGVLPLPERPWTEGDALLRGREFSVRGKASGLAEREGAESEAAAAAPPSSGGPAD
jgi:hypothetical protein